MLTGLEPKILKSVIAYLMTRAIIKLSLLFTKATPLDSYNLEVDTDHTFFIKGIDGVDTVWVHNKDCWADISNNAKQKQVGNDTAYEFDDNGRTVQVIKNPDWKQGG